MPDSGEAIEIGGATPATGKAAPQGVRSEPPPPRKKKDNSRRWLLLAMLGSILLVAGLVFGVWWLLVGSHYVSTDNAYVGADSAQVTPLISGQVSKVLVGETQTVRAGQPLVTLDDADARVALAQANAQLAQAERQVQGYYANDAALAAQVSSRKAAIAQADAQIATARADLAKAQTDLRRRQALVGSGAVSGDELTQAQDRYGAAVAALSSAQAGREAAVANRVAAEGSRQVNAALINGTPAASNPDVLAAKTKVDAARLTLSRTVIAAPLDGVVTRRAVEVGQQLAPGSVIMQVVPTASAYVDANFKEVQLAKVRIGQDAVLTSDLYGSHVKFHGKVAGLAGGTGSAFALIPAQNATGNWIKIVQRLPVRIALSPKELRDHPLRVGLSMKATIHVS